MKSISVALSGKSIDVSKVFATTDELVTLLKTEQSDDDSKKEYCSKVFDETEDEAKMLARQIATTKMRSRTTSISCPTQTLVLRSRRSEVATRTSKCCPSSRPLHTTHGSAEGVRRRNSTCQRNFSTQQNHYNSTKKEKGKRKKKKERRKKKKEKKEKRRNNAGETKLVNTTSPLHSHNASSASTELAL